MKNKLYKCVGHVLVRTPLFPFDSAVSGCNEELFDLSLAVGTRSLFESKSRPDGKLDPKIDKKLRMYQKRISSRCTPYGIFAGIALAQHAAETDLSRDWPIRLHTKTRPDMSWFVDLIKLVEGSYSLRSNLAYSANPNLVFRGGRIWLARRTGSATKRLDSIKSSVVAEFVLNRTKARYLPLRSLITEISAKFQVSLERAERMCAQLCERSFLVSELRFALSCADPITQTIDRSSFGEGIGGDCTRLLNELIERLRAWDNTGSHKLDEYCELKQLARQIAPAAQDLLQTDLRTPLRAKNVSIELLDAMADFLELMLKLSTTRSTNFAAYKAAFEKRYPSGRMVPLLELIDETFGIGSPYSTRFFMHEQGYYPERDRFLLDLAFSAQEVRSKTVELTDEAINKLSVNTAQPSNAPISVDFFCQVSAESRVALNAGNFSLLVSPRVGDFCAGRTIGRFASILGSEATEHLKLIRAAEKEVATGELQADLHYWPDVSRFMNVALAPTSCDYAISADVPLENCENEIPLSEIDVVVENGKFAAYWSKTGNRIMARHSSLLGSKFIPDPIRFLFDITHADSPELSLFDWGAARELPHLPRLVYGRYIIAPARWHMLPALAPYIDKTELVHAVRHWIDKYGVPRLVLVSSSLHDDNQMLLNLSEKLDIQILCDILRDATKTHQNVLLQEYIPTHAWHTVEGQSFSTELVGSFVLREKLPRDEGIRGELAQLRVHRNSYLKALGSDWLYLRLDCAQAVQEDLILQIAEVTRKLVASGDIQKWFFVRYFENTHHLRLRFKVKTARLFTRVLPILAQWSMSIVDASISSGMSIETYDREIERYGGELAMELIESVFCTDSAFIAEYFVSSSRQDNLIFGILSTKIIVDAFELPFDTCRLMLRARSKDLKNHLANQLFRRLRTDILPLLDAPRFSLPQLHHAQLLNLCRKFEAQFKAVVAKILELNKRSQLTERLDVICDSVIHMHCNRLYGIDIQQEILTREILCKALETRNYQHLSQREKS